MYGLGGLMKRFTASVEIMFAALWTNKDTKKLVHRTPRSRFFLDKRNNFANFAQVNPSKMKYLYRYAGDMELTFGEFMFDFMLDIENDAEKVSTFFKAN